MGFSFASQYIASKQCNNIWHGIINKLKKLHKQNANTHIILKNIREEFIKSDEMYFNDLIGKNVVDFRQVRIPSQREDSQKNPHN